MTFALLEGDLSLSPVGSFPSECPEWVASQGPLRRGFFLGNRSLLSVLGLRRRSAAMPALTFLAAVGLVLIALLFVADATLEPGSPTIVTSQRSGLPEPQHHNATRNLTYTPAPAPDMTSQAVLAAQPRSTPDITANFGVAALAARAKVRDSRRVTSYRQTRFFDRFSIKGY